MGGNPCLEWNFRRFPDLLQVAVAYTPETDMTFENPHVQEEIHRLIHGGFYIVMLLFGGVCCHPLLSKTLDWWHNDRWDLAKAPGNVNKKDFIQGTYLLIIHLPSNMDISVVVNNLSSNKG